MTVQIKDAPSLINVESGFDMEGTVATGNGTVYAVSTDEKGHTTYKLLQAGTVHEVSPQAKHFNEVRAQAVAAGMAMEKGDDGTWSVVASRMEPSRYANNYAEAHYQRMRDEWGDYTVWK